MSQFNKYLKIFTTLVAVISLSLLSPMGASATAPTVPSGQQFWAFGWNPQYPILIDIDSNQAAISPANAPLSSITQAEGGGFDPVTGKTWIISSDVCQLWTLDNDGSTVSVWDIQAITSDATWSYCSAVLVNQDGTAYLTGWNSAHGYLIHLNLVTGAIIGSPVIAGIDPGEAWITGLSKNPITGEYWASTTDEGQINAGLYPIDMTTGQLDISRYIDTVDFVPWDIAFDSSGLLWMSAWARADNAFSIKTIDLSAANPLLSIYDFGSLGLNTGIWSDGPDALWFTSVQEPPTQISPQLANTGSVPLQYLEIACAFLSAGLILIIAFKLRKRIIK